MNGPNSKLRVALLGCGQIADAHLQELRYVPTAEVVAVCDVHRDLAEQAALRFSVPHVFDDVRTLLKAASPDVVHVTTPAQTHYLLACELLNAGCHVYVEKPFTLNASEAAKVVEAARRADRRVCVGHDQLFDPAWLRCRELVDAGRVGDVQHVESVLGYPLQGQFGRQVASDANHWVRQLPGGLFHNTVSHPLYRITEFLTDPDPLIDAHWFTCTATFPTELVAHLRGERVTGSVLFSSRIAMQRITRVYGDRGMLEVDLDGQMVRFCRHSPMPGVFGKLESPWRIWREAGRNVRRNIRRFFKCDLQYFAGMRTLFDRFYRSILDNAPPPIAENEIVRVTQIMDEIFDRCREMSEAGRPRSGTPEEQWRQAESRPLDVECANGSQVAWERRR